MWKKFSVFAVALVLGLMLVPRREVPNPAPIDESLPPAQELTMKQSLVTHDVNQTDGLCREQCKLDLQQLAGQIGSNLSSEDIRAKMEGLQQEHPHMKQLVWSKSGASLQNGIASGQLELGLSSKAQPVMEHAKQSADGGHTFQSEPLVLNGEQYFVLGVPSSDGKDTLVGLVHQHILKQVRDHQTKNLRVVPYPAEGNWKIESVDSNTLKDIHVDHPEENEGASHYHKNQVVVKFKAPPTETELSRIRTEIGADSVQKLGYTYVFESKGMEAKQLMDYFKAWGVEYAEPHFLYLTNDGSTNLAQNAANAQTLQTPNDALYSRYQWNLPIIETLQGWGVGKGSTDVKVAVIDTGVDLNHPDLKGHLEEGTNIVTHGNTPPEDDVGHGTHVAGVISALVNNNEGVAGMTWFNPVIPVKVLDSSGSGSTYAVAQGVIWAADHGAKVINMSLGNYADAQFLHDAIKYAFDKDVVIIAASGNDNTERPGYPAAYPEVFAVAATDSRKAKASFSNYGDYIDVAAPGVSIPSTYLQKQYAALSGTSMATPHVSALAALIRSVNPTLKNTEVMEIMRSSAEDIGPAGKDKYFGYGQIDVVKALEQAEQSSNTLSYWPEWLRREWSRIDEKYGISK